MNKTINKMNYDVTSERVAVLFLKQFLLCILNESLHFEGIG